MQVLFSVWEVAACKLSSNHISLFDFILLLPICSSQGFISCAITLYKTNNSLENRTSTRCTFSCLIQRASSIQVNPKQLSTNSCSPCPMLPHASTPGNGRPKTWDTERRCQENKRGKKGRHKECIRTQELPDWIRIRIYRDQYLLLRSSKSKSFKEKCLSTPR